MIVIRGHITVSENNDLSYQMAPVIVPRPFKSWCNCCLNGDQCLYSWL